MNIRQRYERLNKNMRQKYKRLHMNLRQKNRYCFVIKSAVYESSVKLLKSK